MASFELLSENTWPTLKARSRGHIELKAAIAYVTAPHLRFKQGDILVCDASDRAIRCGMTDASTLKGFRKAGADLYSLEGLHAKIAIIDGQTFIGSANMSEGAGIRTMEASLLTDNVQVTSLAHAFINDLIADERTKRIDTKFLGRVLNIEVRAPVRLPELPPKNKSKRSTFKLNRRESQVWFLATKDFSDRMQKEEDEEIDAVVERTAKVLKRRKNETINEVVDGWIEDPDNMLYMVYGAKARILQKIQRGDVLVVCHSTPSGRATVSAPATYLHTDLNGTRGRLIYMTHGSSSSKAWSVVQKRLAKLGSKVHRNSTAQLRGSEIEILDFLK